MELLKLTVEVRVKTLESKFRCSVAQASYADLICRPRMISKDGHLTFMPANNKDIYFDTSGTGRVKVGNEDLTEQLKQVRR